ncbi:MAG TPA: tetratricopeptide repeat protein [Pseudonocardiaceae bacterium]|nr:tetratricopeptide repeat protein [Pseudonocardiaceae bacterium]
MTVDSRVGQAILTALASRPDTKVLPAQLISMVWAGPDVVSVDTLYHHVTRLRRALEPIGLTIVGQRPGYRLPVAGEQIDLAQFDELVRTARALSDADPDEAARRLRAALALWRAPDAVDNLTLPGIRRLAAGWQARRLDAEEDLAEIDLRHGRPNQVLDRLHTLTAAHPDRPRLAAALVRALIVTGRTEQARTVLVDAERTAHRIRGAVHPSLVQSRQALSGAGPATDSASTSVAERDPAAIVVPFQLPADTVRFTGRTDYLSCLLDLRPDRPDTGSATAMVTAVEGMAGIGKTALAVHTAHQLADRFPDGVLFADLYGFTADVDPTPSEQVLDHLLRGLGVPGPHIPPDLEARVGLYRSVLARRRVLIVLDNAAHEAQLQPLLPGTAGCRVIVTSRRHLAGLDEATHLTLPPLSLAEAADLFRSLADQRVRSGDHAVVERIVALCGHLPLAIRITAARLRLAPATTPAKLCTELDQALEAGRGLDWLSDGHRTVAAALEVSYQHLNVKQQHGFRMAGLHPGPDLEPYALAALFDTDVDHAQQLLDDLHAASLLDQPAHRRYRRHDLVAAYASRLAAELTEPDRHAALDRLYDYYAATSSRAMNLTRPWDADQRPAPPASHTPTPELAEQAQCWLDTETDNLLATAHHTATARRADHTLHQSTTLHWHLRTRGHYAQAVQLHEWALRHARATRDCAAEHNALIGLGHVHRLQGQTAQATDCLEQALSIARRTGNHCGEQDALSGLGSIHYGQNQHRCATNCFEQALAIARQDGHRSGEQAALIGLGYVYYGQSRYGPATDYLKQALAIARQIRYGAGEQDALNGLGYVHYGQGLYGPAANWFEQALAIAHQTGHRHGEQAALIGLGYVHYGQSRYGPAANYLKQALAIARQTGNRNAQFEAHQGLGRVHHATRDYEEALQHHKTALHLAVDLNQPCDQARAHDGLAQTHLALTNPDQARHHWRTALDLLANIDTAHVEGPNFTTATIRTHLDDLDNLPILD